MAEFDVVVNVPDDDPSKLSGGMSKEASKQPHEPKKEPKDVATPGGGVFGLDSDDMSQVPPELTSVSTRDGVVAGSFFPLLEISAIYVLEWGLK